MCCKERSQNNYSTHTFHLTPSPSIPAAITAAIPAAIPAATAAPPALSFYNSL